MARVHHRDSKQSQSIRGYTTPGYDKPPKDDIELRLLNRAIRDSEDLINYIDARVGKIIHLTNNGS